MPDIGLRVEELKDRRFLLHRRSSATVYFCNNGTQNCWQHPSAGVSVQSVNSIRVVNVNLPSGSWQAEIRTTFGSARSGAFSIQ
jgi:hypothetical protein